jgi:predicted acetyltransferase
VEHCTATTEVSDQVLLLNLWQLYMHDLSEFRDSLLPENGKYRDDRIRTYFAYDEHWSYLIRNEAEIAGFVLIRKSRPGTYLMGEFFILRKFRGTGFAASVAKEIFDYHPGDWEVPFQNENPRAARFWRRTVELLGYPSAEELVAVEGKPHLPKDVWLRFTS